MDLTSRILAAFEAASSPAQEVRLRGEAELAQLKNDPEAFFSTCARILISTEANVYGRQLVGYQLKNNLAHPACASNPQLQVAVCDHAVVDPQRSIRNVACSIMSVGVREGLWPVEPVVQRLTQMLRERAGERAAVHGAMRALSQIVDDCIYLLDMRQLTATVVQAALPFVSSHHLGTETEALEVRVKALDIMSTTLEQAGMDAASFSFQSMRGCVLQVIEACFTNLRAPPSSTIAFKSVGCIVLSLTFHDLIDDALFQTILQLMYQATTAASADSDEHLRIEATEFWSAVLHFPRFAGLAAPAMETIVPVLIKAMVYSDMEMSMLQANAEDWNVPDKLDDIRPRHFQARVQETNADDADEGGEEEVEEWNLRRVSARVLDDISEYFGEKILFPVLTVIDRMMQPGQHWKEMEAAVLALGAISDGCFDALMPYLPDISSRLLQILEDPQTHFLSVSIALWTCTRIGRYVVQNGALLERLLRCILAKMQSPSKLVQEGALSALEQVAELCEEGQLDTAAPTIVEIMAQCMRGYQLKNRVLLFEVLETVCGVTGSVLRENPAAVGVLMAPLGEVWASTPNDSPLLFSFFKCLSSVCTALGPAMQPMAKDIFERGYGMLSQHVQLRLAALQSSQEDLPEPEYLVTSADLLSGLFDALGSSLEPLMASHQPQFMGVVLSMLTDECAEVRQSGFSLAGDVAKACPIHLQSVLEVFLGAALRNVGDLSEHTYAVISNVAWSLCNLVEHQLEMSNLPTLSSSPVTAQLFGALGVLLGTAELTADMRNMADNVALCLGLMLYADLEIQERGNCPVGTFARRFCEYVRNIKPLPQREPAVTGFLLAVQRCPAVAAEHLTLFFDLACSIASEGPDTLRVMRQVLEQAKGIAGPLWVHRLAGYSEQLRSKLFQVYGLN